MSGETAGTINNGLGHFMGWASRMGLARKLAIALTVAAIASGIATYVALTGPTPFGPDPTTILILLNINLVLL